LYSYLHVPPAANQSPVCLTTDPQTPPTPVLRTVRSGASYFNFRYLLVSLSASTNCLRLLISLPFPSILSISDVSQKADPTQCVSNTAILPSFFLYARYSFPPWLCALLTHFAHNRSNWSCAFFSITKFLRVWMCFCIFSVELNFQHHDSTSHVPNVAVQCFLTSISVQSAGVSLEHFSSARTLHLFVSDESHNKYRLFS